MEILDFEIWPLLVILGLSAFVIFLALRKTVFGVLDPWIWIPVNQALMLTYVAYEFYQGRLQTSHFAYWCIALSCFSLGFAIPASRSNLVRVSWSVPSRSFTSVLIVILSAYQIIADTIFVLVKGVPTQLTPALYGGGFGIVKYIHDANFIVLATLSFLALVLYKRRGIALLGIVALIYPMLYLEWGKAGLLNMLLVFFAVRYFLGRNVGQYNYKKMALALVCVSIFLLYKFAAVSEAGYADTPMQAILKRAINAADSVYLYFVLDAQAKFDQPLNLASFFLAQVLPHFGYLDDFAQRVGILIPEYALGYSEEGYGPSSPFQVIGHLAFGSYGFIYAFGVGIVLGTIKYGTLLKRDFITYMAIYLAAPTLAGDASLFMYYITSLLAIAPPVVFALVMTLAVLRPGVKLFEIPMQTFRGKRVQAVGAQVVQTQAASG